jgi:hypothetical protein
LTKMFKLNVTGKVMEVTSEVFPRFKS